jgi:hypothetical protein
MCLLLLLPLLLPRDDRLVLRLGSEDWSIRETAEAALRQRGWSACPALRRGCVSPDPEIRHRCRALYGIALDETVISLGPMPMLDALWFDADSPHPGYRRDLNAKFRAAYERFNPYLDRLGRDGYPYRNYYLATEVWVREELEAGTDPEVLRPVLDEMRRRDAVYFKGYRPMTP